MGDERRLEVGPGFVRARECPDCGHTRCSEECVCNCDAARAEAQAAFNGSHIRELEGALAGVQQALEASIADNNAMRAERDEAVALLMTTEAMVIDETWFSRRDAFLLGIAHRCRR